VLIRVPTILLLGVLTTASANCPQALGQCPLHQVAVLPNVNAKGGKTSIWRKAETPNSPIFFVVGFHTNTDGARHSYSVKDPWGERDAFNNLCNAMHGECHDLSTKPQRLARMSAVQAAAQAGWPPNQLAATRLSEKVIVMKNGKPCPLIDSEFLVSATALHRPHMKDVCDIQNYTDSSTVPAIVIPGGPSELSSRGVGVGDIVAVLRPGAAQAVFGVVGDTGDSNKLGEASMAMNQLLLKLPAPANYKAIKNGWDVPTAYVMVFPNSKDLENPYMEPNRVSAAGTRLLGENSAELAACGVAYSQTIR
jgi:Fungal chitosanase of glycosyl hydrolase group 75